MSDIILMRTLPAGTYLGNPPTPALSEAAVQVTFWAKDWPLYRSAPDLLAALEEIATAEEDWTATDAGFSRLQAIADRTIVAAHQGEPDPHVAYGKALAQVEERLAHQGEGT